MISFIGCFYTVFVFALSVQSTVLLQKAPLSSLIDYDYTDLNHVRNVHFKYYDGYREVKDRTLLQEESPQSTYRVCDPSEKFAIIIHGWKESCKTEWVNFMVSNLTVFRGGCIICMDYSRYSLPKTYINLVREFDAIAEVLTGKLRQMQRQGFNPNNGFIFGFSYGGRLALEAAKRFGPKKLNEIDICDIAGPIFDFRSALADHRMAAKNVQCIHTSRDKGSRHTHACHQNWKMGNCGFSQVGALPPPMGSHGLCPYFYLSAFKNDFVAIPKPTGCFSRHSAKSKNIPYRFKMGYTENRKSQVRGELFAFTSRKYPYNSNSSNFAQDFANQEVVGSWDFDVDFNAEPNYIPRSRRNPVLTKHVFLV